MTSSSGPPDQPINLLRAALLALGLLVAATTILSGWFAGQPGIGPREATAVAGGVFIAAAGMALGLQPLRRAVAPYAAWGVRLMILGTALLGSLIAIEIYVRVTLGYMPILMPLVKRANNERDLTKIYNARFVAGRAYQFDTFPVPPETFPADRPVPRFVFRPDFRVAIRGGHLVPAARGEHVFWSSNALGLRGPAVVMPKPAGVLRIVTLGASTTEGIFNADDETYPYYLQQVFDRIGRLGKTDVVNAGFSGYTLDDLLAIAPDKVTALDPDLVVLYEGHNDVDFTEFAPGLECSMRAPVGDCWMTHYPGIFSWAAHRSIVVTQALKVLHRQWPPSGVMAHRFEPNGPKRSATLVDEKLRALVDGLRRRGIPVVMSSFATVTRDGLLVDRRATPGLYDDLVFDKYPMTAGELAQVYDRFNRLSASIAASCGVPYVDIAAAFPREPSLFPFDVMHPNAAGNRELAERFARALSDRAFWQRASGSYPRCATGGAMLPQD